MSESREKAALKLLIIGNKEIFPHTVFNLVRDFFLSKFTVNVNSCFHNISNSDDYSKWKSNIIDILSSDKYSHILWPVDTCSLSIQSIHEIVEIIKTEGVETLIVSSIASEELKTLCFKSRIPLLETGEDLLDNKNSLEKNNYLLSGLTSFLWWQLRRNWPNRHQTIEKVIHG